MRLDNLDDHEIDDPNFADLGYESTYFALNMGSLLYLYCVEILLVPVIMVSNACLSRCKGPKSKKVNRWVKEKQDQVFFNAILTSIDAALVVVLLSAVINITNERHSKDFSYCLAVACLALCSLQLILISAYLVRH